MNRDAGRDEVGRLAREFVARGDFTGWFEQVYTRAADMGDVPWGDLVPNPNLVSWLAEHEVSGDGRRALTVGSGFGDDAEALAERGFSVTAFDIAPTAIEWTRRRFPESPVDYRVADVLAPPPEWRESFDFILEAYTLQALPPEPRPAAAAQITAMLAPGGTLLVIARGREPSEDLGGPPWPLTPAELSGLFSPLELVRFEDYPDVEKARPVRRLRAEFSRPVRPRAEARPAT